MLSYDGRRGAKEFGKILPSALGLSRVEVEVGRSSQATLLGKAEITYESLYLSTALIAKLTYQPIAHTHKLPQAKQYQHSLFEASFNYA